MADGHAFGYAEWQLAIDALQIGAVVQPSAAAGGRYRLTTRLEAVMMVQLIRKLAGEPTYSRLVEASG